MKNKYDAEKLVCEEKSESSSLVEICEVLGG